MVPPADDRPRERLLAAEHPEAEALFRSATRIRPGYALGHLNLGVLLFSRGRRAEAIEAEELRPALRRLAS